jgi:hypothetical protein
VGDAVMRVHGCVVFEPSTLRRILRTLLFWVLW